MSTTIINIIFITRGVQRRAEIVRRCQCQFIVGFILGTVSGEVSLEPNTHWSAPESHSLGLPTPNSDRESVMMSAMPTHCQLVSVVGEHLLLFFTAVTCSTSNLSFHGNFRRVRLQRLHFLGSHRKPDKRASFKERSPLVLLSDTVQECDHSECNAGTAQLQSLWRAAIKVRACLHQSAHSVGAPLLAWITHLSWTKHSSAQSINNDFKRGNQDCSNDCKVKSETYSPQMPKLVRTNMQPTLLTELGNQSLWTLEGASQSLLTVLEAQSYVAAHGLATIGGAFTNDQVSVGQSDAATPQAVTRAWFQ
eukprot:1082268-Amphidinium_carterae.4